MSWLSPYRWLLYLALAGSVALGYFTWRSHQRDIGAAPYQAQIVTINAAIAEQKTHAAKLLAEETRRVRGTQNQLDLALKTQEKNDVQAKVIIATQAARLRTLGGPAGRLRDPNATPGRGRGGDGSQGQGASGATGRGADVADGAGLLSAELSGLLFSNAEKADAINLAYISCRADAFNLRESLK